MVKILSRSGDSLADTYDVVGSVAGIEELESREVSLVHEMGGTLFSERFSTAVRRSANDGVLQNANFDFVVTDLPATPTRLLGLQIFSDDASRVLRVAVMVRDASNFREVPIWVFDGTNSIPVRFVDDAGAVTLFDVLQPEPSLTMLPIFTGGIEQPQTIDQIAVRGTATAFGAGTVDIRGVFDVAFSQVGGISSRGLPIPSW